MEKHVVSMWMWCEVKFLLEGLVCYKDVLKWMLNYDVTKLTAELKSTDNAQYKNKIYYFLVALVGVGYRKHVGLYIR